MNIIDRYLDIDKNITRKNFQLAGLASLYIASKYEEIYYPDPKEYVKVAAENFTKKDLYKMESEILKSLKYEILTTSPFELLSIINKSLSDNTNEIYCLAQYLLELSLLEYKMLKYLSSVKASAAMYIARKVLLKENSWNNELKTIFPNNNNGMVKNCAKEFSDLINYANSTSLKNCKKKYTNIKYLNVADVFDEFLS